MNLDEKILQLKEENKTLKLLLRDEREWVSKILRILRKKITEFDMILNGNIDTLEFFEKGITEVNNEQRSK